MESTSIIFPFFMKEDMVIPEAKLYVQIKL